MLIIQKGATDITTYFVLRDNSTHAPKLAVTITDIDVYYITSGAAISAKADLTALAAADSAHADNKGFEVGQGVYRIDWPDVWTGAAGKKVQLIVVCAGVDTVFDEVVLSPAVNVTEINAVAASASKLSLSASTMIAGTITDAALAPSATVFECSDITDATADHYKGRVILFTSGGLIRQAKAITGYAKVGSNGQFTCTAFTGAPANTDTLIIV